MKKLISVAAIAAFSVVAHADGFYCGPDFTVRAEITIPIDAADVGRLGAVYVGGRQYDGGDYSIGFTRRAVAWVPPADGSNALVAYQSFDGGLPSSIAISNICIPGLVFNRRY